jgi:hypothetical protein
MRQLNSRHKLYLECYYEHGFRVALKVANYSKRNGYRILNNEKAKEYLLNLAKQTIENLGLTHSELIKKRLAIADDPDTPAKVRADILKDLAEMVERTQQEQGENAKPFSPRLTPSKQAS